MDQLLVEGWKAVINTAPVRAGANLTVKLSSMEQLSWHGLLRGANGQSLNKSHNAPEEDA
jgi:hypothetical protein